MPQSNTAPDFGKTADQLYAERNRRLQDALAMKQPDRIPIFLRAGYLIADMYGVSRKELHENPSKHQEVLEKAGLYFQCDTISGPSGGPAPSQILGDRMTQWPGHGLGPDGSFQFTEHEFMKAEDYSSFLADPADWGIRTYLPRAFGALEGLAMLPPLGMSLFGYYSIPYMDVLASSQVVATLDALKQAAQASIQLKAEKRALGQRMAVAGFPSLPLFAFQLEAPFDFMSDTLRGMRGIFLDMLRRPEQLLAAESQVARFQIEYAISSSKVTHVPYAFFPLHRGSDGFMSLAQFEKFYWPQLLEMLVKLVEHGITPVIFFEGVWDQRLSYLTQLPKGKTIGYFQNSDIFKVKETVGDTMAIMGGMPVSMLKGASPDQIREYTKALCERVGKDGGFIMTTSIGELEGIDPEQVKVWVDATREYGVY